MLHVPLDCLWKRKEEANGRVKVPTLDRKANPKRRRRDENPNLRVRLRDDVVARVTSRFSLVPVVATSIKGTGNPTTQKTHRSRAMFFFLDLVTLPASPHITLLS